MQSVLRTQAIGGSARGNFLAKKLSEDGVCGEYWAVMKVSVLSLSVLAAAAGLGVVSAQEASAYSGFYEAMELDLDVYGASAIQGLNDEDGVLGGGLGLTFFPWTWLGFGGEGMLYDSTGDTTGSFAGNVVFRAPLGSSRLAVYGYAGAGWLVNANSLDEEDFEDAEDRFDDEEDATGDEDALGEVHVGAGLEMRLSPNVGLFGDLRQTWVESEVQDYTTARVGLRFAF